MKSSGPCTALMSHDQIKFRRPFSRKGLFYSSQSSICPVSIISKNKSRNIKRIIKSKPICALKVSRVRTISSLTQSRSLIVSLMQKRPQRCSKCSSLPSMEWQILLTRKRKRSQATVFMNIRITCADMPIESQQEIGIRCQMISCLDPRMTISMITSSSLMEYLGLSSNSRSKNQSNKIQVSKRWSVNQKNYKQSGKSVGSHEKTKIIISLTYQRTIKSTNCALIISPSDFQRSHLN